MEDLKVALLLFFLFFSVSKMQYLRFKKPKKRLRERKWESEKSSDI